MNIMICNTGINLLHLLKDISDKFPTAFVITNHISELEKCSVASVYLHALGFWSIIKEL